MAIPTSRLPDVAFASEFNYENVHLKGTLATTLDAAPHTIPHNLGYEPLAYVWIEWEGTAYPASQSPYSDINCTFSTDIVNLYITPVAGNEGVFGQAINIYYRIYKEQAS